MMSIFGWVGAVTLASAYLLLTTAKLSAGSAKYHCLNLAGAVLVLINTVYNNAFGPAALNVFWIGISITGIVASRRKLKTVV